MRRGSISCCSSRRFRTTPGASAGPAWRSAPSCGWCGRLGFRVDDYYLRRAGLDYWQHLEWEVVDDWAALTAALPVERHWYFTKFGERSYTSAGFTDGRRAGVRTRVAGTAAGDRRGTAGTLFADSDPARGAEPQPVEQRGGGDVRGGAAVGWLTGEWLREIAVGGAIGTLGAILISGPPTGRSKIARPSWSATCRPDRAVEVLR